MHSKKGDEPMNILMNPVLVSVVVLVVLCLKKINVLIALLLSALLAGVMSGMNLLKCMNILVNGMGGNSETAISYVLLGILASAMANTGITEILSHKIEKLVRGRKLMLLAILAVVACCSHNIIIIIITIITLNKRPACNLLKYKLM